MNNIDEAVVTATTGIDPCTVHQTFSCVAQNAATQAKTVIDPILSIGGALILVFLAVFGVKIILRLINGDSETREAYAAERRREELDDEDDDY